MAHTLDEEEEVARRKYHPTNERHTLAHRAAAPVSVSSAPKNVDVGWRQRLLRCCARSWMRRAKAVATSGMLAVRKAGFHGRGGDTQRLLPGAAPPEEGAPRAACDALCAAPRHQGSTVPRVLLLVFLTQTATRFYEFWNYERHSFTI